jgi:hypothetical protein
VKQMTLCHKRPTNLGEVESVRYEKNEWLEPYNNNVKEHSFCIKQHVNKENEIMTKNKTIKYNYGIIDVNKRQH